MQDGSRSTDNPVEPENVAQDSATRGRPEGDAPRSGKGVLRSVAGGITLVGAVFFMFHLRCGTMLVSTAFQIFAAKSHWYILWDNILQCRAAAEEARGEALRRSYHLFRENLLGATQGPGTWAEKTSLMRIPGGGWRLDKTMEHSLLHRIWMNSVDPPVKLKSVPCLLSCTERHNHMI
jgi:hypothetical protein